MSVISNNYIGPSTFLNFLEINYNSHKYSDVRKLEIKPSNANRYYVKYLFMNTSIINNLSYITEFNNIEELIISDIEIYNFDIFRDLKKLCKLSLNNINSKTIDLSFCEDLKYLETIKITKCCNIINRERLYNLPNLIDVSII